MEDAVIVTWYTDVALYTLRITARALHKHGPARKGNGEELSTRDHSAILRCSLNVGLGVEN